MAAGSDERRLHLQAKSAVFILKGTGKLFCYYVLRPVTQAEINVIRHLFVLFRKFRNDGNVPSHLNFSQSLVAACILFPDSCLRRTLECPNITKLRRLRAWHANETDLLQYQNSFGIATYLLSVLKILKRIRFQTYINGTRIFLT